MHYVQTTVFSHIHVLLYGISGIGEECYLKEEELYFLK